MMLLFSLGITLHRKRYILLIINIYDFIAECHEKSLLFASIDLFSYYNTSFCILIVIDTPRYHFQSETLAICWKRQA